MTRIRRYLSRLRRRLDWRRRLALAVLITAVALALYVFSAHNAARTRRQRKLNAGQHELPLPDPQ